MCGTHVLGFCFSDDLYQIQIVSPNGSARLLFAEVDSLRYFPTGPPSSTATAAISASQKSDKTNWPGQVPIRSIPISSGTEPDYFRNTPTKATIPISVPTKIPANHWHRYTTAPMPKTKTGNRLTTSTATKSAYRKKMTGIHGNLLWYGEYTAWDHLKEETRVTDTAYQPFRLQNQYYKGTSWSPSSNINAFIPTDLLTKRR